MEFLNFTVLWHAVRRGNLYLICMTRRFARSPLRDLIETGKKSSALTVKLQPGTTQLQYLRLVTLSPNTLTLTHTHTHTHTHTFFNTQFIPALTNLVIGTVKVRDKSVGVPHRAYDLELQPLWFVDMSVGAAGVSLASSRCVKELTEWESAKFVDRSLRVSLKVLKM